MIDLRIPADRHPWWVKFCTWTGNSRRAQWIFLWLSLVSAPLCAAVILLVPLRPTAYIVIALGGIGFLISALWYWLAIRWIDQNGTWPE